MIALYHYFVEEDLKEGVKYTDVRSATGISSERPGVACDNGVQSLL